MMPSSLQPCFLTWNFFFLKRAGFDVDQSSEQQPTELSVDKSSKVGAITTDDPHSSSNLVVNQDSPLRSTLGYICHSIVDTLGGARDAYRWLVSSSRPSTTSEHTMSLLPPRIPRQVIRQSYIRDTVNKAIESCSSGGKPSQFLGDKDDMNQFLRHHSCNVFEQIKGFRSLGIWESVEFHVAEVLPDINAFIAGKQEPLVRFIHIITPAAAAHKLPMKSLHIFYDAGEGPIACNWQSSIYLNLRYFEEWHDEDVKNGHLRQAQLSWFFVLAHEIAHNLVPSHDSAHEFWFSAICEAHISDFLPTAVSDA